jgi:hypothetical protein
VVAVAVGVVAVVVVAVTAVVAVIVAVRLAVAIVAVVTVVAVVVVEAVVAVVVVVMVVVVNVVEIVVLVMVRVVSVSVLGSKVEDSAASVTLAIMAVVAISVGCESFGSVPLQSSGATNVARPISMSTDASTLAAYCRWEPVLSSQLVIIRPQPFIEANGPPPWMLYQVGSILYTPPPLHLSPVKTAK